MREQNQYERTTEALRDLANATTHEARMVAIQSQIAQNLAFIGDVLTRIGFPLHKSLIPMLREEVKKGGKLFRNSLGRPYLDNRKTNSQGRVIKSGGRYLSLKDAKKLGLGITPYIARHTVSTYLSKRVTQYEKDRILGHASGISGHYVFVPDEDMIKAINVLPDAAALGCKLCKISANKKGRDGKPKQKVKVLQ